MYHLSSLYQSILIGQWIFLFWCYRWQWTRWKYTQISRVTRVMTRFKLNLHDNKNENSRNKRWPLSFCHHATKQYILLVLEASVLIWDNQVIMDVFIICVNINTHKVPPKVLCPCTLFSHLFILFSPLFSTIKLHYLLNFQVESTQAWK